MMVNRTAMSITVRYDNKARLLWFKQQCSIQDETKAETSSAAQAELDAT